MDPDHDYEAFLCIIVGRWCPEHGCAVILHGWLLDTCDLPACICTMDSIRCHHQPQDLLSTFLSFSLIEQPRPDEFRPCSFPSVCL